MPIKTVSNGLQIYFDLYVNSNSTKRKYVMFYLVNFVHFCKYKPISKLMPATCSKKPGHGNLRPNTF